MLVLVLVLVLLHDDLQLNYLHGHSFLDWFDHSSRADVRTGGCHRGGRHRGLVTVAVTPGHAVTNGRPDSASHPGLRPRATAASRSRPQTVCYSESE